MSVFDSLLGSSLIGGGLGTTHSLASLQNSDSPLSSASIAHMLNAASPQTGITSYQGPNNPPPSLTYYPT